MKIWLSLMLCGLMVLGQAVRTAKSLQARRIRTVEDADNYPASSGGDEEATAPRNGGKAMEDGDDAAAPRRHAKKKASLKHSWVDIGLFVDYSLVSMGDVNANVDDWKKAVNSWGGSGSFTGAGNALLFGGDINCILPFGLGIGPRVEYLYVYPATASFNVFGSSGSFAWDSGLLPFSLGLNYTLRVRGFSASVGMYGGYGWAWTHQHIDIVSPSKTTDLYAEGTCPVFTLPLSIRWNPPHFFAGLDLGYRYANASNGLRYEDDYPGYGIKGDTVKSSSGKTLNFDFSGFNAGVIIGFNF